MSLQPEPIGPVPAETVRVARAAFPGGTRVMRLRDELGPVYRDEDFAPLFPPRGQPALAPWRLALVTVLQFAEGLSDRQAADAVRARIDWKDLLGLDLTDRGFDFSVLSEFRARLVAGQAERHLLDRLLACCQAGGLLQAGGRQRTDATHVLAAIRTLNRLDLVGETLRHALNVLAEVVPDWLGAQAPRAWYERYGTRFEEGEQPRTPAERQALTEQVGADGFRLLAAIDAEEAPAWLREVPAVEVLRRVWLQQFHAPAASDEGGGGWVVRQRETADLPPSALVIRSPYEDEARYNTKRSTSWVGYMVHLTETCDPERPHLITHVATVPATTPDSDLTAVIQGDLAGRGLLPATHLADQGDVDADLLVTSRTEHGVDLVGPVPADVSWQARAGEGFDVAHFAIDWEARRVTCPQGRASKYWIPNRDAYGNPTVQAVFDAADCLACPCRAQCTRGKKGRRTVTVRTRAEHEALLAARERQQTAAFKAAYAPRAGVEGTISQGVRAFGLRRTRYRGAAKTALQHVATAAAVNLQRLDDWWTDTPRARTRRSAFLRLAA